MKHTQLKQLIKEEIRSVLKEGENWKDFYIRSQQNKEKELDVISKKLFGKRFLELGPKDDEQAIEKRQKVKQIWSDSLEWEDERELDDFFE
tara:strand:- start:212 stop:484 length:273 start_codon:yes stop_codon:yes gene_type:complete